MGALASWDSILVLLRRWERESLSTRPVPRLDPWIDGGFSDEYDWQGVDRVELLNNHCPQIPHLDTNAPMV